MAKPSRMKSYVLDLTPEKDAVVIVANTEAGETHQFALPVGPDATEFVGKLIEQCQFAGDYMPEAPLGVSRGFYPTYPLRVGVIWSEPPGGESHPMLGLDYGGCRVDCAIDPQTLMLQLSKLGLASTKPSGTS